MNQSFAILFKSFADSDFFGKGIFISLFALSLICWVIIGYKAWIFHVMKKEIIFQFQALSNAQEGILNAEMKPIKDLQIQPFMYLYFRMREKTIKILEKNQFFSNIPDSNVFLSKDDLALIHLDLDAGVIHQMKRIENGLFILNSSVSLAPFLGILGTVWGILISLFEMQKGTNAFSNTIIIQGLSTALATTVIGLLIAIPALIGHAYLKSISKGIALDLHLFSNELVSKLELQYKKVD